MARLALYLATPLAAVGVALLSLSFFLPQEQSAAVALAPVEGDGAAASADYSFLEEEPSREGDAAQATATPDALPPDALREVALAPRRVAETAQGTSSKAGREARTSSAGVPSPQEKLSTADASASFPPPPEGARWQEGGGLARTACERIANPALADKCGKERAVARYLKRLAPALSVTKGFCLPDTAFDDPRNAGTCTDLSGLAAPTLAALKQLYGRITQFCTARGEGACALALTGGSEWGHRGEVRAPDGTRTCTERYAHCAGNKFDLRLAPGLEAFITGTLAPLAPRAYDQAPLWLDEETGAIFARERDHWDILVP